MRLEEALAWCFFWNGKIKQRYKELKWESLKVKSTDRNIEGKVLKKSSQHNRILKRTLAPNVIPRNVDSLECATFPTYKLSLTLSLQKIFAMIWKKDSTPPLHLITYTADFYTDKIHIFHFEFPSSYHTFPNLHKTVYDLFTIYSLDVLFYHIILLELLIIHHSFCEVWNTLSSKNRILI